MSDSRRFRPRLLLTTRDFGESQSGRLAVHVTERRKPLNFTTLEELLDQLPARVLLNRMPGPVLGVGGDGVVVYANPAATTLLGYPEGGLTGTPLSALLDGHLNTSASGCLNVLREAGDDDVVHWVHADGFPVHTAVSTPLLLRAGDPYLMVQLTDVTDLHWG